MFKATWPNKREQQHTVFVSLLRRGRYFSWRVHGTLFTCKHLMSTSFSLFITPHTHTLTGQTDESMFSVANQFTIILISIDLIDSVSLFKLIYFVCTHFSASVFCVLFCLWRWVYEGGSEQNRRKDHRIGQWPNVFSNIFFSFEIQTKKPNRDRTQFPVAMRLTLLLLCIIHTRTCPHTHKPNLLQSHRARK